MSAVTALAGALLGLSLAAPPGPMNAVIAETTVARGWRAGTAAGLAAMTADALFFLLASVGVAAAIGRLPWLRRGLLAAGGVVMLYFAYGAARTASGEAAGTGVVAAFAIAVTNPYQITWWLTAGVALLDPGAVEVVGLTLPTGGASAVVGFFGGIGVWVAVFPAAVAVAGRGGEAVERAIGYASGALLAWFGVAFLVAAV